MSSFSSAMPTASAVIPIPITAATSPPSHKTRALPPLHFHPSHALLTNRLHHSGFPLSSRPRKPTTTTVPFLPKAMAMAQELLSQSVPFLPKAMRDCVPDCNFYKVEAILRFTFVVYLLLLLTCIYLLLSCVL